jgi:hypothetical protein
VVVGWWEGLGGGASVQAPDVCERALAGTALLRRVRTTLAETRRHYTTVFLPCVFEAYPDLFPSVHQEGAVVTWEEYLWVLGLVWSRGFGLAPPAAAQVRCPA